MNPFIRMGLLVGLLLVAIVAAIWQTHRVSDAALTSLIVESRDDHARFFDRAIVLQGGIIESLTGSYSWWNEMIAFVETPNVDWARENVDSLAGSPIGGDAVWVVDVEGNLIHSMDADFGRPHLPFNDFKDLKRSMGERFTISFFMSRDGEIWQVFGAAIQSPLFWRHETPVRGYFMIGKKWDDSWLARLGELAQARLRIQRPSVPQDLGIRGFIRPLNGLDGDPVALITGVVDTETIAGVRDMQRDQQVLIVSGLMALLVALLAGAYHVLIRPLNRIQRSLESRNPAPLANLLQTRSLLGEIARLIASQFRQGRMLQEEIRRQMDEVNPNRQQRNAESLAGLRVRLARDLHDGPMQSIYAAGLRLAAIGKRLSRAESELTGEIEGIRQVLDECTTNLRNLLFDLEPEELRDHDLEAALERLERYLQSVIPGFELDVENHAITGVRRDCQLQIFYICRELASNAIRHARPTEARLHFSRRADFMRLTWTNDGVLNPSPTVNPGNGLHNIEQRVLQLNGSFSYRLKPQRLWSVTVELPYSSITEPMTIDQPTD